MKAERGARADGGDRSGTPERGVVRGRKKGPVESLRPLGDEIRDWFFSDARDAAVAWAMIVVVLSAVLVWFFAISPYGAPAAPVYAAF